MMKIRNKQIFNFHAELCRTLANPKRLMIIALLAKREMGVGELADALDVPVANISQHLRLLKDREVVWARKNGQSVYYSLTDHRMIEACNSLRAVLLDRMKATGRIAGNIDLDEIIEE